MQTRDYVNKPYIFTCSSTKIPLTPVMREKQMKDRTHAGKLEICGAVAREQYDLFNIKPMLLTNVKSGLIIWYLRSFTYKVDENGRHDLSNPVFLPWQTQEISHLLTPGQVVRFDDDNVFTNDIGTIQFVSAKVSMMDQGASVQREIPFDAVLRRNALFETRPDWTVYRVQDPT